METRKILAANFKNLMAASGQRNLLQVVQAGGGSNGSLDRLRRCATPADVDTLEKLAGVYKMEPWQLLVPTMEAKRVNGRLEITGLPDWPFPGISRSSFDALTPAQQLEVQGAIRQMLLNFLSERDKNHTPTEKSLWRGRIDPDQNSQLHRETMNAERRKPPPPKSSTR